MKSVMSLAIFDENSYFAEGLFSVLAAHFAALGIETHRVDRQHVHEADLIFHYFPFGNPSCFCHYASRIGASNPLYFALRRPENRRKRRFFPHCLSECGVIYHDMSRAAIVHKVTMALGQRQAEPNKLHHPVGDCSCLQHLLTQREQEIMLCMKQEMRISDIARSLDISVKTASNHKMSVMRKMGFQRNTELYCWLRQGIVAQQSPVLQQNQLSPQR